MSHGQCVLLAMLLLITSVPAQFYFGRNKIQYRRFDWHVLTVPHFDIYYYSEEESLAQITAYLAEQAFVELEQKFNHTLGKRVPLVIYSSHHHFQQTNTLSSLIPEGVGGFFEFIKGRVVIPNNGSMHDFRHVLRHELVHVFMHSKINKGVMDAGLWDARMPPLWFTEGLAEWWSAGWDSQAEMVVRDALLNDHLYPLDFLAGYLVYKEGQSFLRYFEEHYSADRLRLLMERLWEFDTFDEALETITRRPYADLMKEWRLDLKKRSAESLSVEDLPGNGSRQITRSGANVSPSIYRDAAGNVHVIYLSSRDGYTTIYRQNLTGGKPERVVTGERTADLESLHFLQSSLSINEQGILAFVTKRNERDEIVLLDVNTNRRVARFSHPGVVTIRSPAWSPDGGRIVFQGRDQEGQSDLYLWQLEPSQTVRLTDDIYHDQDPRFSPDGRLLIFSSDRGRPFPDGGMNLFLLDLDNHQVHFLTSGLQKDTRPAWNSGDPSSIYYVSDRSGTPNVWRIKMDSVTGMPPGQPVTTPVTFLHTGALDVTPSSGDSLLVSVFHDYSFQLHTIPYSGETRLGQPTFQAPVDSIWQPPDMISGTSKSSRPYRLKYSLDLAQTAVAYDPIFGFLGGAQLSISDMLGDRYYHFLLANSATTASELWNRFNVAVTTVNLAPRVNRALGVFHFANDYYDPYQGFYFERSSGIRAGLNYPINVFWRTELSGTLWRSYKEYTGLENNIETTLVSNYISLVHDNSLWTPVGPIDGGRMRLTAGQTFDFSRSIPHNYTVLADLRNYFRLFPWLTLAQRSMFWYNDGTDIRRFYIGGSWGLRGYGLTELYGRKFILLNQELRFPFAQSLMLNLRSMSLGVAPIRGAFFIDAGNAWDDDFPGLVGTVGIGLRGLFLGGLVLRLDMGRHTDFKTIKKGWFTQLFFGWDF